MKQRILIAVLTLAVLGAGYAAGIWTERNFCKVPLPPQLLGELTDATSQQAAPKPPKADHAALAAEIERLRPQIDAFRKRIGEIDREMDRDIEAMLNPRQRVRFQEVVTKFAELRKKEDAKFESPTPLTDEEIARLRQQPLYHLLAIVVIPMRLEWNTRDLNLDAGQQKQLRTILEARRSKFLELVDSSPPPSLTLSRLAPVAQRLVPQKK